MESFVGSEYESVKERMCSSVMFVWFSFKKRKGGLEVRTISIYQYLREPQDVFTFDMNE